MRSILYRRLVFILLWQAGLRIVEVWNALYEDSLKTYAIEDLF
jgi:hypothetical protein